MASLQKLDTVLYEVQQAFIQMSLPPPAGVYDSPDENAQLAGAVANLAGIMVNDCHAWQSQRKVWTLTGDNVRAAWDLPPDFDRIVDGTGWSLAIRQPVVVLDPQQWASVSAWMSKSFFINPACRLMGNQLVFLSAPPVGDITFEYIDANWVIDGSDPTKTQQKATLNSDMPRFDWLLMTLAIKLKWLEQKGMNTAGAQADFNDRLAQLTQNDVMGQVLTLSGPVPGQYRLLDNYWNTPMSGLGS